MQLLFSILRRANVQHGSPLVYIIMEERSLRSICLVVHIYLKCLQWPLMFLPFMVLVVVEVNISDFKMVVVRSIDFKILKYS